MSSRNFNLTSKCEEQLQSNANSTASTKFFTPPGPPPYTSTAEVPVLTPTAPRATLVKHKSYSRLIYTAFFQVRIISKVHSQQGVKSMQRQV